MPDAASQWQRCPHCGAGLAEPLGALGRQGPTCPDCGHVANAPEHPYYGVSDAVEYDFDDVTAPERAEAAGLLIGAGVPYRWEEGFRLFVDPAHEDQVDELFNQPGTEGGDEPGAEGADQPTAERDGDDARGGGARVGREPPEWEADEESAQALARLFDAADRLRHRPDDDDAGAELADAAGVVLVAELPFGVNPVLWATVGTLARQLLGLIEGNADPEDVMAGADALRAVLRDHV